MNIQIYGTKNSSDTRKTERFFKERGIKFQSIDLKEKGLSKGEFNSVMQAVGGVDAMIDPECKDKDLLALVTYISADERAENHPAADCPERSSSHCRVCAGYLEDVAIVIKQVSVMAEEKLKILYLMQMLLEETDPAHPMNATQLCERMQSRYEYSYNRKTIYTDIKRLQAYGMKIAQTKGSSFGYYVEKRDFVLSELKLLVYAVQSSKFITKEKSEDLIRKLARQTSNENAKQLQRQVFIYNRIKADNDAIYSNVDEEHFHAGVMVTVSPQFFGWLAGIGKGIRISWPEDVREEYKQYLHGIIDNT